MCSQALYKGQPAIRWKDFSGGGNIKLKWISKCSLDLKRTRSIKNSFNKGKCLKWISKILKRELWEP